MSSNQDSAETTDRARDCRRSPTQAHSNYGAPDLEEDDSFDDDEYDMISGVDCEGPTIDHPSREPAEPYHFPGTWTRAVHDTSEAMRGVGLASKEFASAITKSGIGKASCSVGRALAATTNHGVVITAGYVLNASGTDQRKLPSMFRKWLGTDKAEAAKRKRERRQHALVRATSAAPRRGRGRQDDQYEADEDVAVVVPHGGVFYNHQSSDADKYPTTGIEQSFNRAHTDAIFSADQPPVNRRKLSSAAYRNPPLSMPNEASPYTNSGNEAYFGSLPMSAGWALGCQSRPAVGLSGIGDEKEVKLDEGQDDNDDEFGELSNLFEE